MTYHIKHFSLFDKISEQLSWFSGRETPRLVWDNVKGLTFNVYVYPILDGLKNDLRN
jgi:hypothetical protein